MNEKDIVYFKEWMTATLSVTKTNALLPGMDNCYIAVSCTRF